MFGQRRDHPYKYFIFNQPIAALFKFNTCMLHVFRVYIYIYLELCISMSLDCHCTFNTALTCIHCIVYISILYLSEFFYESLTVVLKRSTLFAINFTVNYALLCHSSCLHPHKVQVSTLTETRLHKSEAGSRFLNLGGCIVSICFYRSWSRIDNQYVINICRSRSKSRSFVSINSLQSKLKITIYLIIGAMNNIFHIWFILDRSTTTPAFDLPFYYTNKQGFQTPYTLVY